MKRFSIVALAFVFMASCVFQGCSVPNQPYLKKDASEATPLKVQRIETPNYRVFSALGMSSTMIVSGVLLGGIGAGIGYMIHYATTIQSNNPEVPDYGKLVMDKFIERAPKEIANWPPMTVENVPVHTKSTADKNLYVLEIQVKDIRIETTSGLGIETIIVMKDRESNTIWQKSCWYDPNNFSRGKSYHLLKEDNFKLLKEEFDFAADVTVTDFINHFNNSLSAAEKPN